MVPSSRCTICATLVIMFCIPFIIFGQLRLKAWKERFHQCDTVVVLENGIKKVKCEGRFYPYVGETNTIYNICFDRTFDKISTCSYEELKLGISFISCFSTIMIFCGIIVMASICWKVRDTCDDMANHRIVPEPPEPLHVIQQMNRIENPSQDPTRINPPQELKMLTAFAMQFDVAIGKNEEKKETVLIIQPTLINDIKTRIHD